MQNCWSSLYGISGICKYTSMAAKKIVGTDITAPGFIHSFRVMFPRFLLSSIPIATMLAVLPIKVRLPKKRSTEQHSPPERIVIHPHVTKLVNYRNEGCNC